MFELTRGKSARLLANADRLAILLKGLPAAYQKDLQEDKEAVFDTADTIVGLLAALAPAIAALTPNTDRMRAGLTPDLLAVELADALTSEGVPFRDAHAQVGKLWAVAEHANVSPADLPDTERLAISPHFTSDRLARLTVERALARRDHAPGGGPTSVARQLARLESRLGLASGDPEGLASGARVAFSGESEARAAWVGGARRGQNVVVQDADRCVRGWITRASLATPDDQTLPNGVILRRANLADATAIAGVMADYVIQGVLLPRPISELYQCIREFHVAEHDGRVIACAALRVLWDDLGEVRSLAVHPEHHGKGLGKALVDRVVADARSLSLPRVIALTRDLGFFEKCGFAAAPRESMPRKVWTDCVRCPRRHACDEVAVVLDLVPGASAAAAAAGRTWVLPIPQPAPEPSVLPVVS